MNKRLYFLTIILYVTNCITSQPGQSTQTLFKSVIELEEFVLQEAQRDPSKNNARTIRNDILQDPEQDAQLKKFCWDLAYKIFYMNQDIKSLLNSDLPEHLTPLYPLLYTYFHDQIAMQLYFTQYLIPKHYKQILTIKRILHVHHFGKTKDLIKHIYHNPDKEFIDFFEEHKLTKEQQKLMRNKLYHGLIPNLISSKHINANDISVRLDLSTPEDKITHRNSVFYLHDFPDVRDFK